MTVRTRVGRSLTGDYDHFGLRVFRDLAGQTSYLGLVAFAVTGRRLSQADEAILDDLAVSSHVPEPRVWPIKLSRLGSSMGRAVPLRWIATLLVAVLLNTQRIYLSHSEHTSTTRRMMMPVSIPFWSTEIG